LEAGIAEMESMFAAKQILFPTHLVGLHDEYLKYHRVDGKIVKEGDDLMSALRIAIMDRRYARPLVGSGFERDQARSRFARGTANHPDGECDPWTGRSDNGQRQIFTRQGGSDWDPFTGR
jgi:hypothetical protein